MLEKIPEITLSSSLISYTLLALAALLLLFVLLLIANSINKQLRNLFSPQWKTTYQQIVAPDQNILLIIFFLLASDIILLTLPLKPIWDYGETFLGLITALIMGWLVSRIFGRFFDIYLLDIAIQNRRKINSELLILAKISANGLVFFVITIIFSQTHELNILGLLASLGVGGLAVAFAAQKTLEQLLGGIVIFLDRPFVVDDYIGLPDGIFGRVESIGLRSTRIRTSGKGTLVVVPNSQLTQVSIENFTGAKKVISLLYLTFDRKIESAEKAFIRQIIVESTRDIFGIDPRSTGVDFSDTYQEGEVAITQAQISFFILGSGEVSMDLRRQLLDIANQNIAKQLKEYGIGFALEERTINVDSPITI
ncbi:mechanosensitive ion channel family protein [Spirulina subsalsa]|uniref:mechanosensitive ion channel family protein n=1 Tax=Spirulina subsalsa TaxID=54311 RepID=UPI0002FD0162|nr:mechanosensitive ion channel domain-containing protein [Spirulina subsalsa]